MNILNILNNKELSDIPILYILRIINAIQKESIDGKPGSSSSQLPKSNEWVKEWDRCFKIHMQTY